jgi:septal ring-binding cell division protein DamX
VKHAESLLFFVILAVACVGCAGKDMTLSNKGLQAISEGHYEQAEIYLGEALYINPENPYALLNMGVLYHKTGRLEQARQMYRKVIELQPSAQADHSNIDSSAGKSLVELARENLSLLDKEEAELEAAQEKTAPVAPPPPVAPVETQPAPESPETVEEPAVQAQEPDMPEKASAEEDQEGYYRVRTGDTLAGIAGRKDVYGDALKWPRLFHLNTERLADVKVTESFPHRKLPEGLALRYAVAPEHRAGLPDEPWALNVASVQNSRRIVLYAVKLMKAGYRVYLTRAQVSGKEWTRLRVGFYSNRAEAFNAATEIKALLGLPENPWIIRIGKEEMENHAPFD